MAFDGVCKPGYLVIWRLAKLTSQAYHRGHRPGMYILRMIDQSDKYEFDHGSRGVHRADRANRSQQIPWSSSLTLDVRRLKR